MEQYKKDFDAWNNEKKRVDGNSINKFPKDRQIRYVKLWINIGCETDGKSLFRRPVLVLKRLWKLIYCAPLTSKVKNPRYHHHLKSVDFGEWMISSIMMTQCRVLDTKRFIHYAWQMISESEFLIIKKLLIQMYFWEVN